MAVKPTAADPVDPPPSDPPADDPRIAECQASIATLNSSLTDLLAKIEALEKRDPDSPKIATLETELAQLRKDLVKTRSQAATLAKASRDSRPPRSKEEGPAPAPAVRSAPKRDRGKTATGHEFI